MGKVIILGAKGRFGRAAETAFRAGGWETLSFARHWSGAPTAGRVAGDVTDADALVRASRGCDVIVNAVNPPYEKWARELPRITEAVLHAARATGATVMIPGNVYNYGADMPPVLTEDTPWRPTTRKGRLRVEMENAYRDAGVPTIVLRCGDFIERAQTGNWFDSYIAVKAQQGKTTYPGPRDIAHAWAWLPDAARALLLLAEARSDFAPLEEFGFAGYGITGDALVQAIENATGRPQRVGGIPWPLLRLMGLYSPRMREVREMAYLWRVPHVIDDAKLMQALPGFDPTPLARAMATALATSESPGVVRQAVAT